MFTDNPFSRLATAVAPGVMQAFVIAMIVLVVLGTLYDMNHKLSAKYFFDNWRQAKRKAKRPVGGGEMASLAIKTAVVEGLMSGEFCNAKRRTAHLITMYGFLAYAIATIILVFRYAMPDLPTPSILAAVWHAGALMVCLGGYWFWFFIRVDVAAEGRSPFRVARADLFILSLLANATLALVWSWLQARDSAWTAVFLVLYLVSAMVLFGTVAWSKFSHMFYKPAAAFQKRVENADGSRSNLPAAADKAETFGRVARTVRHY